MPTRNPLLVVERLLGDVDTWPSHIIGFLFIELPTRRIIKLLAAFFYGNDICPSLAESLYELCNVDYTPLDGSPCAIFTMSGRERGLLLTYPSTTMYVCGSSFG